MLSMPAKTMLFHASLAAAIENPAEPFAQRIQSSPLAIDICQSIFGLDVFDLMLDCLASEPDADELQVSLGFDSRSGLHPHSIDTRSLCQQLTGLTPVEYSIVYMTPDDTLRLLDQGEDVLEGAPLAYAASRGDSALLEALVDAGADVNALDDRDFSALHLACYHLRLDTLTALIDLAEDEIDWLAQTKDGKNRNVLQLAKESPFGHLQPVSWREDICAILRDHGVEDDDGEDDDGEDDGSLRMPGAFD